MNKFYLLGLLLFHSILIIAQNISLDAGIQKVNGTIFLPGALDELFDEVASGNGYDMHFGAAMKVGYDLKLRLGLKTWNLPFESIANGTLDGYSIKAVESGNLQYSGIYLRLDKIKNYFFYTGGLDLSFSRNFKGKLSIENYYGQTIFNEKNTDTSILTDDFYNQINGVFGMGISIPVNHKIKLKGLTEFIISMRPIYDTGVSVQDAQFTSNGLEPTGTYTDVNLSFFPLIKYGIGIEYKLD